MHFAMSAAIAAFGLFAASTASAGTLVDYAHNPRWAGLLNINSASVPNGLVATGFTLTSASVLTGASFGVSSDGYVPVPTTPRSVTWRFMSVGALGMPGTILAEGSTASFTRNLLSIDAWDGVNYENTRFSFTLPSVALEAGDYFLALHTDSKEYISLLGASAQDSFGQRTNRFASSNGGRTWVGRGGSSVISISGVAAVVPEPGSWVLMLTGFGMIGMAGRYRRRRTLVAFR